MRLLALAGWGLFQGMKSSPLGCSPMTQTKPKQNVFFPPGSLSRGRYIFYVFNLNHAVSSTGLLGTDGFHIGQCSVPVLISRKTRVCFYWRSSPRYRTSRFSRNLVMRSCSSCLFDLCHSCSVGGTCALLA